MCKACEFELSYIEPWGPFWTKDKGYVKSRLMFDVVTDEDGLHIIWFVATINNNCFRLKSSSILCCPLCGRELPKKDEALFKQINKHRQELHEAVSKAIVEGLEEGILIKNE